MGITGHRKLGAAEAWVSDVLRGLMRDLRRRHGEDLVGLSAIAVGADALFADAALELGIRLEVVIPYTHYVHDFPAGPVRARYENLLARAAAVHRMPHTEEGGPAYMAAGVWVVDHCDLLVAVYDGRNPENTGGTADVVHYAREHNRGLIRANPVTYAVEGLAIGALTMPADDSGSTGIMNPCCQERTVAAKIKITAGEISVDAELNDSATAETIAEELPMKGSANRWGEEIYFAIPVDADEAQDARTEMAVGELAYWPPGNAFCIFWGATPASNGDEPRAASNVNPVGKIIGDATVLSQVANGTPIRIDRAE